MKYPENEIKGKGNNSCKNRLNSTKVEFDLYDAKTNSYKKFKVNMSKDYKEKYGKRNFSKVDQMRQKSNLICIMWRQIHIPNFRSISQKTGEKSSEN